MLTAERARQLLRYDEESGCLVHRDTGIPLRHWRHSKGYRCAWIDGQNNRFVHRLVWLVVFGDLRAGEQIDHRNSDRSDNRPSNLRKADNSRNQMNAKTRRDNLLGVKGIRRVLYYTGAVRYAAHVYKGRGGRYVAFAQFPTLDEAMTWRQRKVRELHGEFARAA